MPPPTPEAGRLSQLDYPCSRDRQPLVPAEAPTVAGRLYPVWDSTLHLVTRMLGLGQSPRRSAHDPSPSPISTSLKTQATYPPSVRERARKYPTAVAPPISRRSPRDSPIRRATSSRLSPAARRRARAPASRSATKRTIGSGCAASIAAASVIGSLIGHSARGGSTTTTEKFRQRLPRSGALCTHVARAAGRTRSLGRAAAGRSKSVPIGFGLLRGHRHRREMRCARDQDWSSSSKV